jgi:putative Mg2+ transporter-C (MgtC) family protein
MKLMPMHEIAIRLVIALIGGAIVGYDRERRGHAAGLRTNMLVALGSATFALIGVLAANDMNSDASAVGPVDPTRNIAAIIGGIGFLGAGVIIQARGRIYGLTTATGVWTVAAIGAACGMGYYFLVGMATLLAFTTLSILKYVEPSINGDNAEENGGDMVIRENEESERRRKKEVNS